MSASLANGTHSSIILESDKRFNELVGIMETRLRKQVGGSSFKVTECMAV